MERTITVTLEVENNKAAESACDEISIVLHNSKHVKNYIVHMSELPKYSKEGYKEQ